MDSTAALRSGKNITSVLSMCHVAIFTAVIAVLAQISVPMAGGVPVTLQTLAVALAGIVLGAKKGAAACIVYLILGAVGVPVFTGFKGGIGSLLGVTGGFIVSFPLLSFAAGLASERVSGLSASNKSSAGMFALKKQAVIFAGLIIGAVLNYAVGSIWFTVVSGSSIETAIAACVLPFVVNDIIKLVLAQWLGAVLRRALLKAGLI